MKKGTGLLLPVILAVLLSGCFELREEISLNRNGSGTYRMTLDLGEAMDMLNLAGEGLAGAGDLDGNLDEGLQESMRELSRIEGISEIKSERKDGRIAISYAFANMKALNQATARGNDMMKGFANNANPEGNYAYKKKTFSRLSLGDFVPPDGQDEFEQGLDMARMFLQDARMVTVYRFPRKVKRMTNETARLSEDKKTVTLEASLLDLMDGKADLANEIRIK